jgi:seryl-tRNA synthetase
MLDINAVRENPDFYKKAITQKKGEASLVDKLLHVDEKRRSLIGELQSLRELKNKYAKEQNIDEGKKTKIELSTKEPELTQVEAQYKEILWSLPNPAAADVPVGEDESSNKVIRSWGTIPHFDFPVKDHIELGEDLDIIDVKKASDVSGARFAYLKGDAALLEFALVSFAFSVLTNEETLAKIAKEANLDVSTKPFVPVVPPVMIKPDVFDRMARLKPEEERYHFPTDDMYLVGSAEHTLGALHINEMLPEKEFPKRYVGFSTSFRREAGSYGRDTKGILRVHQFDKVEIESFTTADNGAIEQDFIVAIQEYLMRELGLAYEVMAVCTGDMGGPDFRQVDINTWIPSQDKYRETHSSDYNTDYQSRRLNTRVKRTNNEAEFVHMNDATVFAIGRTLIAILENNQQADGSILIPQALQKWIGKDRITKRS